MGRWKIITGGLAIAFGGLMSWVIVTMVTSPIQSAQKQQAILRSLAKPIAAWIVLALPSLTIGIGLWHSWRKDRQQSDRDRLHTAFIQVLCQNGGYVSPLQLAAAPGLDRAQAKAYLQGNR